MGRVEPLLHREAPRALAEGPDRTGLMVLLAELCVLPLVLFLIAWKWIDVSLLYHCGGMIQGFPSFSFHHEYARQLLSYPGGVIDYASAFWMQSLCFSWLGACVLTLLLTLLFLLGWECLRFIKVSGATILAAVPAVVALGIFATYEQAASTLTSLLLGIGLAYGWLRLRPQQPALSVAGAALLIVLFAILAPQGMIAFTIILCAAEADALSPGALRRIACLVAAGLMAPLAAALVFGFGWVEIYSKLLPLPLDAEYTRSLGQKLTWALYGTPVLLFCLASFASALARRFSRTQGKAAARPGPRAKAKGASPHKSFFPALRPGSVARLAFLATLPVLAAALTHNPELKIVIAADRAAWQGRWSEVMEWAKVRPVRSPYLACAVAQAMFHTGQLWRELPPLRNADELTLANDNQIGQWRRSDLYLDLGFVNKGLHHLTESIEFWGERPLLLRRLAQVNLALGNVPTAQVYLRALAKVPFQAGWAREQIDLIRSGRVDEEINRLRACNLQQDSVVRSSVDEELLLLLKSNPANKMAYEYLMTYYLLSKDLRAFALHAGRIAEFPGLALSPLWEEALLLAQTRSAGNTVPTTPPVGAEVRARFQRFQEAVRRCADGGVSAAEQLRHEYGQSYFYYFFLRK